MKRLFLLAAAAAFIATPALAEDTITVGFTDSQTGPLNVNSLGQQHGYEFWRDEVNAAGGIKAGGKTYKVKFVSYDDQSVGGRVQQLYTRLINQDKANFLFSPYSSGLTAPAAVISEQYGKIMINSGGAEEKPFEQGNKYLFMVITSASHYLSGAVAALKAKDPSAKIAMVYSDDPFSKAVLAAAAQQAKAAGLQVVMDEVLFAVNHRFRSDRQQDHLVERRCGHGRRTLFGWRHARAADARPEGQYEVDFTSGRAGRRQVR